VREVDETTETTDAAASLGRSLPVPLKPVSWPWQSGCDSKEALVAVLVAVLAVAAT